MKNKISFSVDVMNIMKNAKRSEKRKDDFINMTSHELRTPVTSMSIYLQLLHRRIRDLDDNLSLSLVHKTQKQVDKMITFIDELIDLSSMQQSDMRLEKEYFSVDEVLKQAILALPISITHHAFTINISCNESIYADKRRILQVLTNILMNAIKYSSQSTSIIITTSVKNESVIISIQDFGIGISAKDQEQLFCRFYQVKQQIYPGFGIGLYMAKKIIEKHKGKIWVDSEEGRGSTFSFSLPRGNAT